MMPGFVVSVIFTKDTEILFLKTLRKYSIILNIYYIPNCTMY